MHMIRKGQFTIDGTAAVSFADQFYALAGQVRPASAKVMLNEENRRLLANATEPSIVRSTRKARPSISF